MARKDKRGGGNQFGQVLRLNRSMLEQLRDPRETVAEFTDKKRT